MHTNTRTVKNENILYLCILGEPKFLYRSNVTCFTFLGETGVNLSLWQMFWIICFGKYFILTIHSLLLYSYCIVIYLQFSIGISYSIPTHATINEHTIFKIRTNLNSTFAVPYICDIGWIILAIWNMEKIWWEHVGRIPQMHVSWEQWWAKPHTQPCLTFTLLSV